MFVNNFHLSRPYSCDARLLHRTKSGPDVSSPEMWRLHCHPLDNNTGVWWTLITENKGRCTVSIFATWVTLPLGGITGASWPKVRCQWHGDQEGRAKNLMSTGEPLAFTACLNCLEYTKAYTVNTQSRPTPHYGRSDSPPCCWPLFLLAPSKGSFGLVWMAVHRSPIRYRWNPTPLATLDLFDWSLPLTWGQRNAVTGEICYRRPSTYSRIPLLSRNLAVWQCCMATMATLLPPSPHHRHLMVRPSSVY